MTYVENGVEYPMRDTTFPTVDPQDPLKLTEEEQDLMLAINASLSTARLCTGMSIFSSLRAIPTRL